MIITPLNTISRFKGISPNLDVAFDYLSKLDLNKVELHPEQFFISDGVKLSVFDYMPNNGKPGENFEAHKEWMDIHLVVKGEEKMPVASAQTVEEKTPYSKEKDIAFYKGKPEAIADLYPGDVLVAFPEDYHQPGVKDNDNVVRKLVMKVKVDF